MKPNQLLGLALVAAGTQAALKTLLRRRQWEAANKRVQIVVDYEDVCAVSLRAGISRGELFIKLRDHGATGVSLPELTLARGISAGRIVPIMPRTPRSEAPPLGDWVYL